MRILRAVLFVLVAWAISQNTTHAQGRGAGLTRPPAPHALRDPKWWVGEATIIAATALDAQSTCRNFSRGYVEDAIVLRGSNSCKSTIGVIIGADVIYTALHLFAHKYVASAPQRSLKAFGYLEVPVIVGSFHGYAAAHNYSLAPTPAQAAARARLQ